MRVRPRLNRVVIAVGVCAVLVIGSAFATAGTILTTTRVSVNSNEAEANQASFDNVLSATGRFVAFTSEASNLVPGDSNGEWDVFVRDRNDGTTRRISVSSGETQGNGESEWPSISLSGRYVAFESDAPNLVKGDTNAANDVFVRDRKKGTTTRVSRSSKGRQGNGDSYYAAISGDGRFVAFASDATNLVHGDTNGETDLFVHDLVKGTTTRISRSSGGTQSDDASILPTLSSDGRFVAFVSYATNLVGNDLNDSTDVFVRDRKRGTTKRVSVASDGTEGDMQSDSAMISSNGRFVAFASYATNLVGGEDTNHFKDIFVRDRVAHSTTRVSMNSALSIQGNDNSDWASISADGRFVAFHSDASDLIGGEDTNGLRDVFVRDREAGITFRVSLDSSGTTQGNADSSYPVLSANGRFVSFLSDATDLVPGDLAGYLDVFVRGPLGA